MILSNSFTVGAQLTIIPYRLARPSQSPDSAALFIHRSTGTRCETHATQAKCFEGIVVYTSLEERKVRQDSKALRRPQPRVCSLQYGSAK